MGEDDVQADCLVPSSAMSLPDTRVLGPANATNDNANVTLDDVPDSIAGIPQVLTPFDRSYNDDGMAPAIASILSDHTDGKVVRIHKCSSDEGELSLIESRQRVSTDGSNDKKKQRRDKQTIPHDGRQEFGDNSGERVSNHLSPGPQPSRGSESRSVYPTDAALGRAIDHAHVASSNLCWESRRSPPASRPLSTHQKTGPSLFGHTNNSIGEDKRNLSYCGPRCDPAPGPSQASEPKSLQSDQMSDGGEHVDCEPTTNYHGSVAINPQAHQDAVSSTTCAEDKSRHESVQDLSGPEHPKPVQENPYMQDELPQAEKVSYTIELELRECKADIDRLCEAWLKACAAAEVPSEDVAQFHSLSTDSIVNTESRAAAHQELVANKLLRCITDLQQTIESLQVESKQRNGVIATSRGESSPERYITSKDPVANQDCVKCQDIREEEQRRYRSLKEQYKCLKTEAGRMYQPELERRYRESQASLIELQDRNTMLVEEKQNVEKEASFWQGEVKIHKEELARCSSQYHEQTQIQNEEMLRIVKEYRDKIQDSTYWDKDGLLIKYERLEHEQVMLIKELKHAQRNIVSKDKAIEELVRSRQQDQKEIEELRGHWQVHGDYLLSSGKRGLSKEEAERLRDRLQKQREDEDREEALKRKVRHLGLERLGLAVKPPSGSFKEQRWFLRWNGDEYFDKLTEAEKEISKRL